MNSMTRRGRLVIGLGLLVLFTVVGCASGSTAAPSAAAPSSAASGGGSGSGSSDVALQNFAFNPATITVKVGSTVTWTNKDSAAHTVTADDGSFDSKNVAGGATFQQSFSKAGTFNYHCAIHPTMKGSVTVQ